LYVREYRLMFDKIFATIHPRACLFNHEKSDATAMDEQFRDFASHLQRAAECAELLGAYHSQAKDFLDAADEDEADDDTRRWFMASLEAADACCKSLASCRAAHGAHKSSKK